MWEVREGNPLVAVEMMREIQDRAPAEALALPRRAREVIGPRLERLAAGARSLLTVAALLGGEVELALLRHAGQLDAEAAAQAVEELVRRRVLTAVGERLGITHERVREVAYAEAPSWRRPQLHRRIAESIEALHADRLPDFWEALADHWERGEAGGCAPPDHLRVAERAKRCYAYVTAEVSCRQAAEAAARNTDAAAERVQALELLGDVRSLRGDLDRANDSYEAARAVAPGEPDRRRIGNKLHRPRT